jgi:CRP/FNR family transcriptional regulator, cyclic AMP receptor protein
MMDTTAVLAAQPLFEGLAPGALREARQAAVAKTYKAGETIFLKGDPPTGCHIVVSGFVRLSVLSAEGRELSVRIAGDGSMFGEIAVLDAGVRTTNATCITAVRTLMLPRPAMAQMLHRNAEMQRNAIALLCARLRATTAQAESIALHQLEARTAAALLTLFSHVKGERRGRYQVYQIDLSQRDIAALAGASRPKVNQVLMQWSEGGLVQRDRKRWSLDVDALQDIAEEM